jgi:hypothetical protein
VNAVLVAAAAVIASLAPAGTATAERVVAGYNFFAPTPMSSLGVYGPLAIESDSVFDGVTAVDLRSGRTMAFGAGCPVGYEASFGQAVSPDGESVYALFQVGPKQSFTEGGSADDAVCGAAVANLGQAETAVQLVRLGPGRSFKLLGAPPTVDADRAELVVGNGSVLFVADGVGYRYDSPAGRWDGPSPTETLVRVVPKEFAEATVRTLESGDTWGYRAGRVLLGRDGRLVSARRVTIPRIRAKSVQPASSGDGVPYACSTDTTGTLLVRGLEHPLVSAGGKVAWAMTPSESTNKRRYFCKGYGGVPDERGRSRQRVERFLLRSTDGGVTWRKAARLPKQLLSEDRDSFVLAVDGGEPVLAFSDRSGTGLARFTHGRFRLFRNRPILD